MRRRSITALAEALESRVLLASAMRISDILSGPTSSLALQLGQYGAANGKFFFTATDANGQQPYVSDGTKDGTKPLSKKGIGSGSDGGPYNFLPGDGVLYFTAPNPEGGGDIYQTIGIPETGTQQVTSLPSADNPIGTNLINGNPVFFTDGKSPGVYKIAPGLGEQRIKDISGGALNVAGGRLFFDGDPNNGTDPSGLYSTNGNSVKFVKKFESIFGAGGYNTLSKASGSLNGEIFFTAVGDGAGFELWKSNGTSTGTVRLADIAPADFDSTPRGFTNFGTSLYFIANSGTSTTNYQIYATDGTKVTPVTALTGTSDVSSVRDLTDVNDTLFFTYSANGGTRNLYKLIKGKPTLVGTTAGGTDGGTNPTSLTAAGANVYFSGTDKNGNAKLFVSDGTSITLVGGDTGINPKALTNVNGTLFFQASDAQFGAELHVLTDAAPPPAEFGIHLRVEKNHEVTHTIKEGESLRFICKIDADEATKIKWFWQDGTTTVGGLTRDHQYLDNLHDDATRTVRVEVTTKNHGLQKLFADVTVKNVAPTIEAIFPQEWVVFLPLPISSIVTRDVEQDNVKVQINWGDGTTDLKQGGYMSGDDFPIPGFVSEFAKTYSAESNKVKNITVTATDKDGASTTMPYTVPIVDLAHFDKQVLVSGTSLSDDISFQKSPSQPANRKSVRINIIRKGGVTDTLLIGPNEPLMVSMGPGDDKVHIDKNITNPFVIFGGDGKDDIFIGGGATTVQGGGGADKTHGAKPGDVVKK